VLFLIYGVKCHAIEVKKCPVLAAFKTQNGQGNGFYIQNPKKGILLRDKNLKINTFWKRGFKTVFRLKSP